MRRTEATKILHAMLRRLTGATDPLQEKFTVSAREIMDEVESLLAPPKLPSDHCQAIMSVYVYPDFNMWEEDFEKDEELVKALERRLKHKK